MFAYVHICMKVQIPNYLKLLGQHTLFEQMFCFNNFNSLNNLKITFYTIPSCNESGNIGKKFEKFVCYTVGKITKLSCTGSIIKPCDTPCIPYGK